MNKYIEKLASNFAALNGLSINLINGSSRAIEVSRESVGKLREFVASLSEKISILVRLPDGVSIEDNFYPYATYAAFIENNPDNKNLLEEFSYKIDKIVVGLRGAGILDKDCDIDHLPKSKMDEVFGLIRGENLQEIEEYVDKLSANIKAAKFIRFLWEEEVQKFLLKKRSIKQEIEITEAKKQKSEMKVSEDWHQYFEKRAEKIKFGKKLKTSKLLRTFIYAIPTTSFIGIFLGIFVSWPFNFDIDLDQKTVLLEIGLFNIFMVSALSYHLKQVLREIAVLKHLKSSYLHRAIVAKTFQSLVATDHFKNDKGDIVVKEAALAMFKKEAQGYLSKDQLEPSNTPVQEVVGIFNRNRNS